MEPCCENLENRTEPELVEGRSDLTITRCKVCGRRHFELTIDPAVIGVRFADGSEEA
jgi:hypothetical protein